MPMVPISDGEPRRNLWTTPASASPDPLTFLMLQIQRMTTAEQYAFGYFLRGAP
jgi:hypothetical protein